MRVRFVLLGLAVVTGLVAMNTAEHSVGLPVIKASTTPELVLLAAGWSLVAGAMAFGWVHPGNPTVLILMMAASCWFVAEWDNPGGGSAALFTAGLALSYAAPPLVGWTLLAFPVGRIRARGCRVLVGLSLLAGLGIAGLLPTLFADPAGGGCSSCPRNVLLLRSDSPVAITLSQVGLAASAALLLATVLVGAVRFSTLGLARRTGSALVGVSAAVFLTAAALAQLRGVERGFVGTGSDQRLLWHLQAIGLFALGVALALVAAADRRRQLRVAHLSVRPQEMSVRGGLRAVVAAALGDPDLVVAYPVGDDHFVDADGTPVYVDLLAADARRTVMRLERDGVLDALVIHRTAFAAGAVDRLEGVLNAARLALEQERLTAQLRAQERDLRASRRRLVEAADEERRTLERDLHDGAQQRLLGVLLGLQLARRGAAGDAPASAQLDEITDDVRRAVTALRHVAHGIHPVVLSDEGLAAALEELVETERSPIQLEGVTEERFPADVESAAYMLAAAIASEGGTHASVARRGEMLVMDLRTATRPSRLTEMQDRVGALDGRLTVQEYAGEVCLRAEIPCG